ncbi:MAG: hypothetical protein FWC72_03810 [Oscillospiraceae bacterium]|nr:hypothetical protein [Oscillospiraceae bacterium]
MKLQKETWDIERIKELTMQKIQGSAVRAGQSAPRRFQGGFVAIAAVIMLVFATTALAVSGVIDFPGFGSLFQSVFNNEAAAPYVRAGEDITVHVAEGDVEVELISAFIPGTHTGRVFLELEIHDPTGIRLSDSLMLLLWDDVLGYYPLSMYTPDTVQFIDDYRVRAAFDLFHSFTDETAREMIVRFDTIASGVSFVHEQVLDFNIGAHIGIDSPVAVPGAEFIQIKEIIWEGDRLIVTHHDTGNGWGSGLLSLMKPDGEIILNRGGSSTYGVPGQRSPFFIGSIDPHDLTLVWSGQRAEHLMHGDWAFTIPSTLETRILEGEFEGHPTRIYLSATNVRFYIFHGIDIFEDNPLVLYLADGTRVEPKHFGAEGDHRLAVFDYPMDFVHSDEVVRITFRGVEISG